jgi:SAM-dependent methyltransferase
MTLASQVRRRVREGSSFTAHKLLGTLGVTKDQHCCACGRDVPGFYFFSYRAYGCPYCRSSPRERFVAYAFDQGLIPRLPSDARILHVAPAERNLVRRFAKAAETYVAGDVDPRRYARVPGVGEVVHVDLTDIPFSRPFDLIYASHVLEHIPDDRLAMRQVYEHLRVGGCAVFLVPLRGEVSEDGGPELSAAERQQRFGQWDHVRQYGLDIVDRLTQTGFEVTTLDAADVGPEAMRRFGFETHGYAGDPETDRIFVCRRG